MCTCRTAIHLAARGAHAPMLKLLLSNKTRQEQEVLVNQPVRPERGRGRGTCLHVQHTWQHQPQRMHKGPRYNKPPCSAMHSTPPYNQAW